MWSTESRMDHSTCPAGSLGLEESCAPSETPVGRGRGKGRGRGREGKWGGGEREVGGGGREVGEGVKGRGREVEGGGGTRMPFARHCTNLLTGAYF